MINILIPYDDQDESRGEYFRFSQKDLIRRLGENNDIEFQLLNTETCIQNSIDTYTSNFDENPFILIAYAHGTENTIEIEDEVYISNDNAYLFGNTLVYSCSCKSAKALGEQLIDNGCRVFLGFSATISSAKNETEPIFYHCENAFLVRFLSTNETVQECLSYMYDEYSRMKLHLLENYGVFDASVLENNLSAFSVKYLDKPIDSQLTKAFFDV
jgi:hypothetical protein